MENPRIIIRADATPHMGTGHVMRCIALAQVAQSREIPVTIIGHIEVPWVQERLASEGIEFINLEGTAPVSEDPSNLLQHLQLKEGSKWVVLDGYHFGFDCQKVVRNAGYKLLVIDDYAHLPEYSCDILLNQNLGSDVDFCYRGEIGIKLLGTKYLLIRQEFIEARKRIVPSAKLSPKAEKILITVGGGDFSSYFQEIASAINSIDLDGCLIRIIAGSMPTEHISSMLQFSNATVEILKHVEDVPRLLSWADFCITAGGSTCWELCCLGVPFLVTKVAENQTYLIKNLTANKTTCLFSESTFLTYLHSYEVRAQSSMAGLHQVDSSGAARVLGMLLS